MFDIQIYKSSFRQQVRAQNTGDNQVNNLKLETKTTKQT